MSGCRSTAPPACPPYNPPQPEMAAKFGLPPFGFEDLVIRYLPRQVRFKDFTDGTSHTMLLSEIIMDVSDDELDIRGDMLNDDTPCTMYMTYFGPNAGTDLAPFHPPVPNPARIRPTRLPIMDTHTNPLAAGILAESM